MYNECGIRQILSQNPLFSIGVGHIFVNFSSDVSHFLFRKKHGADVKLENKGTEKRASRLKRQIIVLAGRTGE